MKFEILFFSSRFGNYICAKCIFHTILSYELGEECEFLTAKSSQVFAGGGVLYATDTKGRLREAQMN